MIFSDPISFRSAVSALQTKGQLPRNLSAKQLQAIRRAIEKNAGEVARDKITIALDKVKDSLQSVLNPAQVQREPGAATVTEGLNPATARVTIQDALAKLGGRAAEMNVDFTVKTAVDVAQGGGRFLSDQEDVDEYPAWELSRMYDRNVPRGFRVGPKGALISVPTEDWPHRWEAAAIAAGDHAALRVFKATGRMVALKQSGIWQALGDGAGGYTDTLGNPFPPFAYNSGFDVDGVSRSDCEELGLLRSGEVASRTAFDPAKLFSA